MNLTNSNLKHYRKFPWIKFALLVRFCEAFGILFEVFMKQIPLSQGKFAIIDDEDYDLVVSFNKWQIISFGKKSKLLYVRTSKMVNYKTTRYYLHRVILNSPVGFDVDHIDGNGLNNQKSNLRICLHGDNIKNQKIRSDNTSGYKGVSFHKKNNKWASEIHNRGKKIYIGTFNTPEEAARAYDEAAKKYHGDFAKQNG